MSSNTDAMRKALEALCKAHGDIAWRAGNGRVISEDEWLSADVALTAAREALATCQQAQEPQQKRVYFYRHIGDEKWTEVTREEFSMKSGSTTLEFWALYAAAPANSEQAHRWATELATNMARKFYPDVPQFEVLPDLVGVISQIDNMTTGLVRANASCQDEKADMFWNDDDPEQCGQSIHEIIDREYGDGSVNIGDVMTIQRAVSLPKVDVRLVAAKDAGDDWDYEIIEGRKQ